MGKGARGTTPAVTPTVAPVLKSVFSNPVTVGEWIGYTLERMQAGLPVLPAPAGCVPPEWVTQWSQDAILGTSQAEINEYARSQLDVRQSVVATAGRAANRGSLLRLDYLLLQLYANRSDVRREVVTHDLVLEDSKRRRTVLTAPVFATTGYNRWFNLVPLVTLGDWADAYWSGATLRWTLKSLGRETSQSVWDAQRLYIPAALAVTPVPTLAQATALLDAARAVALGSIVNMETGNRLRRDVDALARLLGKVRDALVEQDRSAKK